MSKKLVAPKIAYNVKATTLAKVTSHGSGGFGKALASSINYIMSAPITSAQFKKHSVGAYLVLEIELRTNGIRRIKRVTPLDYFGCQPPQSDHDAVVSFYKIFKSTLNEELEAFNNACRAAGGTVEVEDCEKKENIKAVEAIEPKTAGAKTPDWYDGFFMPKEELKAFEVAYELSAKLPAKIMMIGPSGYGKTTLGEAFAIQRGMNFVRFNVALVRDPEEFFGYRTAENGTVKFIESEFTKAIKQGNTVVVLDELNRASSEMHNALFPILDDAGRTTVFGEEIVVGPRTIIVATVNVGYQFTGTFALDQALVNRMDITLRVGPLNGATEAQVLVRRTGITMEDAAKIVKVCQALRNLNEAGTILVDASTRTSLKVARIVASGKVGIKDAFRLAVVNGANIDEQKDIIDAISSCIF